MWCGSARNLPGKREQASQEAVQMFALRECPPLRREFMSAMTCARMSAARFGWGNPQPPTFRRWLQAAPLEQGGFAARARDGAVVVATAGGAAMVSAAAVATASDVAGTGAAAGLGLQPRAGFPCGTRAAMVLAVAAGLGLRTRAGAGAAVAAAGATVMVSAVALAAASWRLLASISAAVGTIRPSSSFLIVSADAEALWGWVLGLRRALWACFEDGMLDA